MDDLRSIDRLTGYSKKEIDRIQRILKELDTHGHVKDEGFGAATDVIFPNDCEVELTGFVSKETREGIKLCLFYSSSCVFSNFYPAQFIMDGKLFHNTEQYFNFAKARKFGDVEAQEEILRTTSPAETKKWGRKVKNFNDQVWRDMSVKVMTTACYRKFQQNPSLRRALLSTNGQILVEASPRDRIWGIGMGGSNPLSNDPSKWKGSNKLGRVLTVIREHMISTHLFDKEM